MNTNNIDKEVMIDIEKMIEALLDGYDEHAKRMEAERAKEKKAKKNEPDLNAQIDAILNANVEEVKKEDEQMTEEEMNARIDAILSGEYKEEEVKKEMSMNERIDAILSGVDEVLDEEEMDSRVDAILNANVAEEVEVEVKKAKKEVKKVKKAKKNEPDLNAQIDKLKAELERVKQENEMLKRKLSCPVRDVSHVNNVETKGIVAETKLVVRDVTNVVRPFGLRDVTAQVQRDAIGAYNGDDETKHVVIQVRDVTNVWLKDKRKNNVVKKAWQGLKNWWRETKDAILWAGDYAAEYNVVG